MSGWPDDVCLVSFGCVFEKRCGETHKRLHKNGISKIYDLIPKIEFQTK
jgi:hypothetical protein